MYTPLVDISHLNAVSYTAKHYYYTKFIYKTQPLGKDFLEGFLVAGNLDDGVCIAAFARLTAGPGGQDDVGSLPVAHWNLACLRPQGRQVVLLVSMQSGQSPKARCWASGKTDTKRKDTMTE